MFTLLILAIATISPSFASAERSSSQSADGKGRCKMQEPLGGGTARLDFQAVACGCRDRHSRPRQGERPSLRRPIKPRSSGSLIAWISSRRSLKTLVAEGCMGELSSDLESPLQRLDGRRSRGGGFGNPILTTKSWPACPKSSRPSMAASVRVFCGDEDTLGSTRICWRSRTCAGTRGFLSRLRSVQR